MFLEGGTVTNAAVERLLKWESTCAGLFAEAAQTDAYAGLGCEYMGNHRFALMLAEALPLAGC